ncbi:MAG: diaminopimelate epimerase [Dehalococcoidia bacterium]|nr:diaminopimelate epimerase [Dehalococcoidia bacterium]
MTNISFWKMHGAGNDFFVTNPDANTYAKHDWSRLAVEICDRHLGVGADGIILVLPSEVADMRMQIINADGSEPEMCVNGIRCFVKYCLDQKLCEIIDSSLTVETLSGIVETKATVGTNGFVEYVRIELAEPDFDPLSVGVETDGIPPIQDIEICIGDTDMIINSDLVSMGNPHAVSFIETKVADYALTSIGPLVENNQLFADRTNFEIVNVIDRSNLTVRVWERGVGETLACGSGACAVVAAAHTRGFVDNLVDVKLPGGTLNIEWDGEGAIILTGPVTKVFEGGWEV